MSLTSGSFSSPCAPCTEICMMMSTWPPCSARICGCWSAKKVNSVRAGSTLPPQCAGLGRKLAPTPGVNRSSRNGPVPLKVFSKSPA